MTNEERQQAIEWLKGRPITMPGAKKMFALAVEALEAYVPEMNVGETESSHENDTEITRCSDDTISRQAAIDAIQKLNIPEDMCVFEIISHIEVEIATLPSAQPERRCVNCGRTVNNGGWYEDGRTRCPIEEHYALPKDGYCHLWEKRKDWEDDYVKRAEEGEK